MNRRNSSRHWSRLIDGNSKDLAWHAQPVPPRWHRCRVVQVHHLYPPLPGDKTMPELIGRCPCGAVAWLQRSGPRWTEKNSRRKLAHPHEEMDP